VLRRLGSRFARRDRGEMKINRVRTRGNPQLHPVPPGPGLRVGWQRCGSPRRAGMQFPRAQLAGLPGAPKCPLCPAATLGSGL